MTQQPILYIEDEEDYQILVRRILARVGLEAAVACTGAEGFAALNTQRPSMLILDINLPDTDGYAICGQIRQDPAWVDLPILMLTVRRRPEEWLKGFSSGANDYLSKPLDPPGLIERVQNGLHGKLQPFSSSGTPEYHLIRAAAAGNRAAFEILIQKYRLRLMDGIRTAIKNAEDVEDIASHAFVIAFENMHRFRGEASFFTWLYRIAINQAYEISRRSNALSYDEVTRNDEIGLRPRGADVHDPVHQTAASRHEAAYAREVLGQVPPIYRRVLELYFLKNLPYGQIAKKVKVPLGTVMSRLYKARQILKEIGQQSPMHP